MYLSSVLYALVLCYFFNLTLCEPLESHSIGKLNKDLRKLREDDYNNLPKVDADSLKISVPKENLMEVKEEISTNGVGEDAEASTSTTRHSRKKRTPEAKAEAKPEIIRGMVIRQNST